MEFLLVFAIFINHLSIQFKFEKLKLADKTHIGEKSKTKI